MDSTTAIVAAGGIAAALIGAGFAILGVWLGVRWTHRDHQDDDRNTERRRNTEARNRRVDERLDAMETLLADIRERLAGLEAIIRWQHPALGDDPRSSRVERG